MASISRPAEGADDDPAPPGLDLEALRRWLRVQGLHDGPLTAELIPGGRSNLTYAVDAGEHTWVLRRPPMGHVLATAHDMGREYQVISALHGSAVPVPQPVALCADPQVLGAPFYLMQRVPGLVLRSRADISRLTSQERHAVGLRMMDTLADLHAVDPVAVGLGDFGHPEGFLGRQVRRWGQQLDRSRSRPLPGIDVLRVRLAASVPPAASQQRRSGIVHGDYRLDNLILDEDTLHVAAVLDWEMSTLGDTLADLGLLLAYGDGLGAARNPVAEAAGPSAGFPTSVELVERYAARAGLREEDLAELRWAKALGFFKIAVILEGIHYRWSKGQTVGPGFDRIGEMVPALVEAGLAAVRASPPPTRTRG
jgi:aminoglycoside phosphotransferase (APT) family kinase protein